MKRASWIVAQLPGRGVAGLQHADGPVHADGQGDGIGGDGDLGGEEEAVRGHDAPVLFELEGAGPGVGGGAVRQHHLEEAVALDRQVELVLGELQLALGEVLGHRHRPDAVAELDAGGGLGVLGGRPARRLHGFVEQVLEFGAAAFEPEVVTFARLLAITSMFMLWACMPDAAAHMLRIIVLLAWTKVEIQFQMFFK